MSVERTALGVTGAAFMLRALSGQLPAYARIGYALVGWNLVRSSWNSNVRIANPLGDAGQRPSALPSGPPLKFERRKVRSIGERVALIHQQALKGVEDPTIYKLAKGVVTQRCGEDWCIPERDYVGEVSALFQEVRKRVRYTFDPVTYDAFQTPMKTIELASGDCDDMTALLASMVLIIGHPVASRVVWTKGNATWNHIYLRARLPKPARLPNGTVSEWFPLDPTVDEPPGWEVPADMMVAQPRDFPVVPGA